MEYSAQYINRFEQFGLINYDLIVSDSSGNEVRRASVCLTQDTQSIRDNITSMHIENIIDQVTAAEQMTAATTDPEVVVAAQAADDAAQQYNDVLAATIDEITDGAQ